MDFFNKKNSKKWAFIRLIGSAVVQIAQQQTDVPHLFPAIR